MKQQTTTKQAPATTKEASAESGGDALKRMLAEYTPYGEATPIELSAASIQRFMAIPSKKGKLPTFEDCVRFAALCKARLLNPLSGDAYMVGFDTHTGTKFEIITAYQALSKRAEGSARYDGIEEGLIIMTDGVRANTTGAFYQESMGDLVGAWARVYRSDRKVPIYKEIIRSSYDKGLNWWKTDPALMACKIARAAALREAFPTTTGGMYVREEIGEGAQRNVTPKPKELPSGPDLGLPAPEAVADAKISHIESIRGMVPDEKWALDVAKEEGITQPGEDHESLYRMTLEQLEQLDEMCQAVHVAAKEAAK